MSRLAKVRRILSSHGVALAYVFGSQAELALRFLQGDSVRVEDPLADIDVGVVFSDRDTVHRATGRHRLYAALHNALSDVFPKGRLDLVFLQETHSVFQARAIAGRCIYAVSEQFKDAYEHRILARAADFRLVLDRYHAERLEEIPS